MKNMLSVASFTEEEISEGDMCSSKKWKCECKGGGQRGGFAEAGAAEGPPSRRVRRKQDRWLWAAGAEESEMTLDSWLQPRWALMRTREKNMLRAVETGWWV